MRVRDGSQLKELVDRSAAALVAALELDRDAGAAAVGLPIEESPLLSREGLRAQSQRAQARRREVLRLLVERDFGAVGLGVHRQLDVVRWLLGARLGVNHHGLAGGDEAVHACRGDADALLAATHLQTVELGPIEQPAEDVLNLLAHDARAVVDDGDAVARALRGGWPVGLQVLDRDRDVGQDARLLARVEGVVDSLLDGGQQRLAGVVEAEQVPVLREELADGDVALARGHFLRGEPP